MNDSRFPEGSYIDSDGKVWINKRFDVMANNNTRFVRQIKVKLQLEYKFEIGRYALDVQTAYQQIISQYPSLASVKKPHFIETNQRLAVNV